MHAVAAMINKLKATPGVAVFDCESAWRADIGKDHGLLFEVAIPKAVLEWFVTAKKDGREVWSDWTEHYAASAESRTLLEQEMARDVENFIRRVLESEITVSVFTDGSATLLWARPDGQQHVTLYEPGA